MKVEFLRLPGNGQKQLDFPGESVVTLRRVLDRAREVYNADCSINNEIAVNGQTVDKNRWDSEQVYAGDLVSATGVVKGALHYCTKF
jgi:hypothetical protein